MNSHGYLTSYGWIPGEALKHGGLKKPILVTHKKDKKGLGHEVINNDVWWERVFDGQLKGLDISIDDEEDAKNKGTESGITFKQSTVVPSAIKKNESPLYRRFVKGEGLQGTLSNIEESKKINNDVVIIKTVDVNTRKEHKLKKKGCKVNVTTTMEAKSNDSTKELLKSSKRKKNHTEGDKTKKKNKAKQVKKAKEAKEDEKKLIINAIISFKRKRTDDGIEQLERKDKKFKEKKGRKDKKDKTNKKKRKEIKIIKTKKTKKIEKL